MLTQIHLTCGSPPQPASELFGIWPCGCSNAPLADVASSLFGVWILLLAVRCGAAFPVNVTSKEFACPVCISWTRDWQARSRRGWGVTGKAKGLRAWEGGLQDHLPWGSRKTCLGPEAYTMLEPHCSVVSDLGPVSFCSPHQYRPGVGPAACVWYGHVCLCLWVWSV